MIRALRRNSTILPIETPCGSAMKITSASLTASMLVNFISVRLRRFGCTERTNLPGIPLRCHLGQIRPRMIEQQPHQLATRISRTANHGNVVNLAFHYVSLVVCPHPDTSLISL